MFRWTYLSIEKLDKYRKYNNDGIDSENDFVFEKQWEWFGGDDNSNGSE